MVRADEFEVRAALRWARIAPRKVRVVAGLIQGRPVPEALAILAFSKKRGARILRKLLESAVANAQQANLASEDALVVSRVLVDKGPVLRRWRARARGRATRINKFTSHVQLFVADAARWAR